MRHRPIPALLRGTIGVFVACVLVVPVAVWVTRGAAGGAPIDTGSLTIPNIRGGSSHLAVLGHQMHALTAISASRPHSHPLIPVGNERPHDGTYGPTNLSTNWSGIIESGQGTAFTAIQGDWVVPGVGASTEDEDSGTWIGIDGVDVQTLIQTGTAQDSGPDSSDPAPYYAWVELLPNQPGVIGNSSGPAPVEPGDVMAASIVETSTDEWTIDINDTTQNWSFSQEFSYDTPGDTAEWIEEAPTVNTGVATLADYGSTTFTELGTDGTGLASADAIPSYMANQSGAIISYPADIDPSTDSFSLFYGSPSPQVTSVTPNQGSTSGGTTVVVEGNFITGVTSVDFGGVSVPFTADIEEGTVSAASPPSSAGTVEITVTTPGGTSEVSDVDQFTYVAPPPPPPSPPAQHGYWLVGSDGGIFTFGSAQFYGSTGSLHLQRPVVGITPTASRGGYWLVASDGGIFNYGDAGFYGSIPGLGLHPAGSGQPNSLNAPIVGMVPSADGGGYFMVASDGGVFAFGDARFAGSCPGIGGCSGAAVAVMPDASGNGYWVVTSSGSVYPFGDAVNYGAPGSQAGGITSAVATPDGGGYWILGSDGQVFNFGNAAGMGSPPSGSAGGLDPANAIFATSDGGGYWVATALGHVSAFGDAPDDGDMSGTHLNGPIVAASGS